MGFLDQSAKRETKLSEFDDYGQLHLGKALKKAKKGKPWLRGSSGTSNLLNPNRQMGMSEFSPAVQKQVQIQRLRKRRRAAHANRKRNVG